MILLALLLAGCDQQEKINSYTVPPHETLQTPEFRKVLAERQAKPARMLAAIVPHGKALWFFKLQGPPESVSAKDSEFRTFLKSIRFSASGTPEWTLLPTWKEQPNNPMMAQIRHSTLLLDGDPPLEVTVTTLPGSGNLTDDILANINRWRNQLDLPFIQPEDLESRTETIESGEIKITLLNISGRVKPKRGPPDGMPPMAAPAAQKREVAEPEEPEDIRYEVPKEWTEVRANSFTLAVFEVTEGTKKVTISLSRAGGSTSANVNRWRGQMGLDPLPEEEVLKSLQKVNAGSRTAQLAELKSDTQTMLGLMIPDGGQTVFVKLVGDPELATRERARFDAFANSLKF